ncbi:MAG: hypothetical protein VYA80_05525 [Pseudomonadota bacterium]|nr:hypothetical protein [Pseudomonadota bacterium]
MQRSTSLNPGLEFRNLSGWLFVVVRAMTSKIHKTTTSQSWSTNQKTAISLENL